MSYIYVLFYGNCSLLCGSFLCINHNGKLDKGQNLSDKGDRSLTEQLNLEEALYQMPTEDLERLFESVISSRRKNTISGINDKELELFGISIYSVLDKKRGFDSLINGKLPKPPKEPKRNRPNALRYLLIGTKAAIVVMAVVVFSLV